MEWLRQQLANSDDGQETWDRINAAIRGASTGEQDSGPVPEAPGPLVRPDQEAASFAAFASMT